MTSTPLPTQPGRAAARRTGPSMPGVTDLERFWPSRRGHAFDELCR